MLEMNRRTLLKNLNRAAKWAANKERDHDEAVNIMMGCFRVLEQTGQQGIPEWINRRPDRRRSIKHIRDRYLTPKGNKVLRDLVTLTVSATEACTWRTNWLPGPLPVQVTKPVTSRHLHKMKAGRARKKAALEAMQTQRNELA